MRLSKFLLISSALGAFIPVLFMLLKPPIDVHLTGWGYITEKIMLVMWPSSFFLMALGGPNSKFDLDAFIVVSMAVGGNVIVYAAFGALLWAGIYKAKWLLVLWGILIATFIAFIFGI